MKPSSVTSLEKDVRRPKPSSRARTIPATPAAAAPAVQAGEAEPPRGDGGSKPWVLPKGAAARGGEAPVCVSVIVLDDAVRARLSAVLGTWGGIEIVSSHADFKSALRELPQARPRVTVVGSKLFLISGPKCLERLSALVTNMRALMLGTSPDWEPVLRALQAGAAGYALASAPPEELARAILEVARGGVFLCQEAQQVVADYFRRVRLAHLTPREREVCFLLVTHDQKDIAELTNLSVETVHTYIKAAYRKLKVHGRAELRRRLAELRREV